MKKVLAAFWCRIIRAIEAVRLYRNWPCAFLCYFRLLRHRQVKYVLRNNITFIVRANDLDAVAAISDVWLRRIYTPLRDEIQDGYTIIDIGAHIGSFSVFASTLAEDVKVYSYEPSEENYYFLTENIKLNRLKNVKAFRLAVSAGKDKVRLYLDEKRSTYHSIATPGRFYEEVNSVTLEDVLVENQIDSCDLLKMDCEGAEYEILSSTPKSILTRIRNISLEYHDVPTYQLDDLKMCLKKMGFNVRLGKKPILYARRRDKGDEIDKLSH